MTNFVQTEDNSESNMSLIEGKMFQILTSTGKQITHPRYFRSLRMQAWQLHIFGEIQFE